MPAYRAVLFDFFGTLTHAVTAGRRPPRGRRTARLHPGLARHALDETYFQRASGRLGDAADCLRWVCDQAGVRPTERGAARRRAGPAGAVRDDTRLRADAVATLRALRARGLLTGVISDCTHELPACCRSSPVAPLLDTRVFSVEVGRCKPDPSLYLHRLRGAGGAGRAVPLRRRRGQPGTQRRRAASGMTAVRLAAPDLAGHLVYDSRAGMARPDPDAASARWSADGRRRRRRSAATDPVQPERLGRPPGPPGSAGAARPASRPAGSAPAAGRPSGASRVSTHSASPPLGQVADAAGGVEPLRRHRGAAISPLLAVGLAPGSPPPAR